MRYGRTPGWAGVGANGEGWGSGGWVGGWTSFDSSVLNESDLALCFRRKGVG